MQMSDEILRDALNILNQPEKFQQYHSYLNNEWLRTVDDLRLAIGDEHLWSNLKLPARLKLEIKRALAAFDAKQSVINSPMSEDPSQSNNNNNDETNDYEQSYDATGTSYGDWTLYYSEEHSAYYWYHTITGESQWAEDTNYSNGTEGVDYIQCDIGTGEIAASSTNPSPNETRRFLRPKSNKDGPPSIFQFSGAGSSINSRPNSTRNIVNSSKQTNYSEEEQEVDDDNSSVDSQSSEYYIITEEEAGKNSNNKRLQVEKYKISKSPKGMDRGTSSLPILNDINRYFLDKPLDQTNDSERKTNASSPSASEPVKSPQANAFSSQSTIVEHHDIDSYMLKGRGNGNSTAPQLNLRPNLVNISSSKLEIMQDEPISTQNYQQGKAAATLVAENKYSASRGDYYANRASLHSNLYGGDDEDDYDHEFSSARGSRMETSSRFEESSSYSGIDEKRTPIMSPVAKEATPPVVIAMNVVQVDESEQPDLNSEYYMNLAMGSPETPVDRRQQDLLRKAHPQTQSSPSDRFPRKVKGEKKKSGMLFNFNNIFGKKTSMMPPPPPPMGPPPVPSPAFIALQRDDESLPLPQPSAPPLSEASNKSSLSYHECLRELKSMGFDESESLMALAASDCNLDQAVAILSDKATNRVLR